MKLESLANELLLDIFELFSTAHLFRAFHGLNTRFHELLLNHIVACHVNFRSISKEYFDIVCRQYLPSTINRIISLQLSNDDETPQQTELFLSHDFILRQFTHLRSLTLSHVRSRTTMFKLMTDFSHLSHLTRIKIVQCQFIQPFHNSCSILDCIWSLPKLTHCYLDMDSASKEYLIIPTVISMSLEYLSLHGFYYSCRQLNHLLEHTPRLRYLSVWTNDCSSKHETFMSPVSLITTLKLSFQGLSNALANVLQSMPNLCSLTVRAENIHLDGHEWKKIIVNNLPKLKIFRLAMHTIRHEEYKIDQFLDTYRTDFWLNEHQWYVQCDGYLQDNNHVTCLYTIPYAFADFLSVRLDDKFMLCKSTDPHCYDSNTYNCVQRLGYNRSFFNYFHRSQISFSHLRHLSIVLPFFEDQLYFVLPTINQLNTLIVSLSGTLLSDNDTQAQAQLQTLLDKAPRLYSLIFNSSGNLVINLVECTSASVRRLDFQGCTYYFNDLECNSLIHSLLGAQCEVLRIDVKNRTHILDLVNTMTTLRALSIRCEENAWDRPDDIKWLQDRLPVTCTMTIDPQNIRRMRLWIR